MHIFIGPRKDPHDLEGCVVLIVGRSVQPVAVEDPVMVTLDLGK